MIRTETDRRSLRGASRHAHRVAILAGFVLTFAAFYPGLTSPDSEHQFIQAAQFRFSDGHPIVMALLWAAMNRVVHGPLGFFILLMLLYWGGFGLICSYFARRSRAAYGSAIALPFLPFVINFSGTIWKDALVFDCFLVAAGIGLTYAGTKRRVPVAVQLIVFLLLIVGSLARYNSVLSAIPLALLVLWPVASSDLRLSVIARRAAVVSLALVLCAVAATAGLTALVRPEKTYTMSHLMLFDLVGISTRTGTLLVPGRWTEEETRQIQQCYDPRTWDTLWLQCDFMLSRLRAEGRWRRLFRPWLRAIGRYPLQYTAHRLAYVGEFFRPAHLVFNSGVVKLSYEYGFSRNVLFRAIETAILTCAATFPLSLLFTKAFWFLAAPAIFVFHLWFFRRRRAAAYPGLLISASAMLYTTPLVIVGIAHDFRYVYWGIGASCVAAVLALDSRSASFSQNVRGDRRDEFADGETRSEPR